MSRATAAFRAGVGAVALALAVSTAAPALASGSVGTGEQRAVAKRSTAEKSVKKLSPKKAVRSIKVSHSRPVVGSKVRVSGRTQGAKRRVVLQVRSGKGAWRTAGVTRTRHRTFSFTHRVDRVGARSFRVVARTAPKAKQAARHARPGKRHHRSHRAVKSRRVVSRVVRVVPKRPVVAEVVRPAPAPAFADEVRRIVDAAVREYRAGNGVVGPLGTNACMARWADGFAGEMARTNIFAHSPSSEWDGRGIVSHIRACESEAPGDVRQEAIGQETGATPQEVADKVLAAWKDAWMHDEVILDDFGHDRVMSVGVARGDAEHGWYVVAVFAAAA